MAPQTARPAPLDPVRPSRVEIDLGAVAHNVRTLARHAGVPLWAVVKADAYGHGAVPVARAALVAGAAGLAVALVEEARTLREAGIDAPVLLLSEPPLDAAAEIVALGIQPAVYSAATIDALEIASGRAASRGSSEVSRDLAVHLKVDTGMRRVGCQPDEVVELAQRVHDAPHLRLASVWTHLAVADEPESDAFTTGQLDRLDVAVAAVEAAGIPVPLRHAANSAGLIAHPRARHDLVRAGIAIYGLDPAPALAGRIPLQPALRLVSAISHVKRVPAGEGVSYGLRYRPDSETVMATVPVGYADGLRRALGTLGGEALVGGRRVPVAGTVTMDQILLDCGPGAAVERGEEVVLLGRQGAEEITAGEWAERLGTIVYEITCGLGPRLPRRYIGHPEDP